MNDEHEGMGGSYTADPKTGKRTLVERTEEAKPDAPADPEPKKTAPGKTGQEGN